MLEDFYGLETSLILGQRQRSEDEKPSAASFVQDIADGDFAKVLRRATPKLLFKDNVTGGAKTVCSDIIEAVKSTIETGTSDERFELLAIAIAALSAFLQSSVTGPPLSFKSAEILFGHDVAKEDSSVRQIRQKIVAALEVDGEAIYRLIPNAELFMLAKIILCDGFQGTKAELATVPWWISRVLFLHQRMLDEKSATIQRDIYKQYAAVESGCFKSENAEELKALFLMERGTIHIFDGHDAKAREDLEEAAGIRKFEFALTGQLGRRTKFQEFDTSQLVVLAKSYTSTEPIEKREDKDTQPADLKLDDDTLLEKIAFKPKTSESTTVQDDASLPESLRALDAANQPLLQPLDATILLSIASSVSEKAPASELTREETVPFATRVLQGGSSNWQVYTQALLVRSRIEGFRSRTIERGLLQLQALVDQIIAETSGDAVENGTSTFLPKASREDSAPVAERLRYIYQLNCPSRWEVETELAGRWAGFGGLKTALEIYERLEKWVEVALCYAAVEQDDKARLVIRKLLFQKTPELDEDNEDNVWDGEERMPPPTDAPRLWCILGDISKNDIACYEKSWETSKGRYARAQRSIGRHRFIQGDHKAAADAYLKALKINAINFESWYALGCARIVLQDWNGAAEAFGRSVQLNDQDPEAWSNLGTALLKRHHDAPAIEQPVLLDDEEAGEDGEAFTDAGPDRTNQDRRDALLAFKRAVALSPSLWRVWDNILTVAGSIKPPVLSDVILAMRRLAELRGPAEGEGAIEVEILEKLVRHVVTTTEYDEGHLRGIPRLLVELVDKTLMPLITTSPRLWRQVAALDLWRNRPGSSLAAQEKAWRAAIATIGWETGQGGERTWNRIVDATLELVDSYESLGPRERTEGLGAGSGELIAKDWMFKARSAIRSVLGKAKELWEGTEGWTRLKQRAEDLRPDR